MTSPERPYNQDIAKQIVEQILATGSPNIAPLEPTAPMHDSTVVQDPGFEHYPTALSEARTGVGGLFRVLTHEGREERRAEKEARRERSRNVAAQLAGRIRDPRNVPNNPADTPTPDDPREKLGWVGTNKTYYKGEVRPEDYYNVGKYLLNKGGGPDPSAPPTPGPASGPNSLRPVTWREKAADRRLEAAHEKALRKGQQARWLANSYNDHLNAGSAGNQAQLSYGERRHARKISRRAQRIQRGSDRAWGKFDKIGDSEDWRGRHLPF